MARTRTRIRVPIEFDRWIDGLEDFDPSQEVLAEWERAMERFYGHSQETVHRISGALQESGRHDTQLTGRTECTGELVYGGTAKVDYAIYEHERDGDHAWMTRAFAMSRRDFERALAAGVDRHVRSFM
jgi:hypothetical protein